MHTIIKERRKSKIQTYTEIILQKKSEWAYEIENQNDTDSKLSDLSLKFINKEQKKEALETFLIKKNNNLKILAKVKIPSDSTIEIMSSEKINDLNQNKILEDFINAHPYRSLVFSPAVLKVKLCFWI